MAVYFGETPGTLSPLREFPLPARLVESPGRETHSTLVYTMFSRLLESQNYSGGWMGEDMKTFSF